MIRERRQQQGVKDEALVTYGTVADGKRPGQAPYSPADLAISGNPHTAQLGQHVAQSIYTHLQSDSTTPTHH